ncbi:chemotaxis protein CheW [Sphingopyxis sp. KK2]|uniref:chemotaxis protein CheW n=1 Tax=Sphingopyxis sp. KK2 TaxID=1855727 RepID=UPI00097E619A|nr:chemotaxis protein CheW [Sphingopyxis sp. KK2]
MAGAPASIRQILAFRAGECDFALAASDVLEVARLPALAQVPHAPDGFLGLASLRGSIVPILSAAKMLTGAGGAVPRWVVVVDAGERIGLAVDAVHEIAAASDRELVDVAALAARFLKPRTRRAPARRAAAEASEGAEDRVELMSLEVAGQLFALPLAAIDTVARVPDDVAPLPHADAPVIGSIRLGDAALPLLSLAILLGLPQAAQSARSRVVIVRIGRHRVGLLVDALQTILRVDADAIDPLPQALSRGHSEARVQAICRIEGGGLVSVLAADHLLRPDITARLTDGVADLAATGSEGRADAGDLFLLFSVGDDRFALPAAAIEEVAAPPAQLTAVPGAPGFLGGLMNHRGLAVPVVVQSRRFGRAASAGAGQRLIFLGSGESRAAFLVDAISGVRRIADDRFAAAPSLGGEAAMFDRVVDLPEASGIHLVIGPRQLLDQTEAAMVRDAAKRPLA